MDNKLPDVFPVPVEKKFNNVQEVFYGKDKNELDRSNNLSIESKINRIFNSSDYIYKKKVTIVTNKGTINKTLVGKTDDYLLTMDNEKIKISDITDIN